MGLSPEQRRKIEERRNEVLRRSLKEEPVENIAKDLEISVVTVRRDQDFLRGKNLLEIPTSEERIEKRQEEVRRRFEDGKEKQSVEIIAKALGVSKRTIYRDIEVLIEKGLLPSLISEIKRMTEEGETAKVIGDVLGISERTVGRYRRKLRDENLLGPLVSDEESIEERRLEVERKTKNNETAAMLAESLGVSLITIERDRRNLKDANRLPRIDPQAIQRKRMKSIKLRLTKSKKAETDKTKRQIAEEIGVSTKTIKRDEIRIREEEEKDFLQRSERVIEIYNDLFFGQAKYLKYFEKYLELCKQRYEERMISEEHIEPIKYAVLATEKYSNVAFYIKLCIRFDQFEEAIQFARSYVNCENFTQEEREKVKRSREKCEKYRQAINMLKRKREITDGAIDDIMKVTGLTKVEVAILRKKIEKQKKKDEERKQNKIIVIRNQEENDDADEQGIEIS